LDDGWKGRQYKTIKQLQNPRTYLGAKKGWTPNYNSTFKKVPAQELQLFDNSILTPFFDINLEELASIDLVTNPLEEFITYEDEKKDDNESETIKMKPQNKILYGPPGTGKTFITRRKAVEISGINVNLDDRDAVKIAYQELLESGQVVFTTFHQSYSYEDFVEGIKADSKDGNVTYDIESGIFKQIAKDALDNWRGIQADSRTLSETRKFSLALGAYQERLDQVFEKNGILPLTDNVDVIGYDDKGIRYCGKNWKYAPSTGNLIKYEDLFELFAHNASSRQDVKNCPNISGLAKQHASYTIRIYNAILEIQKGITVRPKVDNTLKQFVLIIDEINRGNISKIFGELITLIEESKRDGADDPQSVILPYSKKSFVVPPNLHIIGTMNTADRSIALLDTALRRRFEFEEMMPDPKLLSNKIEGIDIQAILTTINERIEYLYDRDHTIGHAYFMKIDSKEKLDSVMKNKVIPLLQEYFYDDWEKIQIVLGDHYKQHKKENYAVKFTDELNLSRFIQSKQVQEKTVLGFNHDDTDESQIDYRVNPSPKGFPDKAYTHLIQPESLKE